MRATRKSNLTEGYVPIRERDEKPGDNTFAQNRQGKTRRAQRRLETQYGENTMRSMRGMCAKKEE